MGRRTDLGSLMATTTGMVSLQEGLQHDRGLWVRADDRERTVAIADLEPPDLRRHDWATMQAALPTTEPPAEPFAAAAPADFWYMRFDSPATLGVCTSVAYPPPGALVPAPYRVGVARFDAGISVLGIVLHDAAPGDAVEPVVLSLEDGGTSFAFAPAP